MTTGETLQAAALILNLLLIPGVVFLSKLNTSLALNTQAMGDLSKRFGEHVATDEAAMRAIHRRLDFLRVPAAGQAD